MRTTTIVVPATGIGRAPELVRKLWGGVVAAFESPPLAYGLLVALQLKVMWGFWAVNDMVTGDIAYYYANAWRWYTTGYGPYAWSPLYTAFYSLFLHVNPDPVWATVAHRIVVVLAVAVLVLAVFRRFLPAGVAWLCAAWWAVNPITYDAMYEVHLFALIPTLTAAWLLATATTPWRRAAGCGVLGMTVLLCRNELSVALGVLGLGLLVLEVRRLRRGEGEGLRRTLTAYAVAGVVAGAVCGLAYGRSNLKGEELAAEMHFKHTLPMRQMYATGYAQRHPEWKLRGMTQGDRLMTDTFGRRDPTLAEMVKANPGAVAEHASWNLGLLPNGVQFLLFNRASGPANPDFFPPTDKRLNHGWPVLLLCALAIVWLAGVNAVRLGWSERWREWFAPRSAGWFLLLGLAVVAIPVTLTCRPRPCYLFGLGVALVTLTGTAVWVLAVRLKAGEVLRGAAPVVAVVLLSTLPTYAEAHKPVIPVTRDGIAHLLPFREELATPGISMIGSSNGVTLFAMPTAQVRRYLTDPVSSTTPNVMQFTSVELGWKQGEHLHEMLTRIGADYFYADERLLSQLQARRATDSRLVLEGTDAPGWRIIDRDDTPAKRVRLYRRVR